MISFLLFKNITINYLVSFVKVMPGINKAKGKHMFLPQFFRDTIRGHTDFREEAILSRDTLFKCYRLCDL